MASAPFYASEIPVVFRNQILIPTNDKSYRFLLGPMGNCDPTWLINAETNRIPFKQAKPNVSSWKHTFRSWPSKLNGYRTWHKRIAATKQVHWDEIGIGQCITLSLADTKKNEPLMSAATYFWSSTLNTFLFRQGPMTPTLIDVKLLTGLDIQSEINPFSLLTNSSHKLKTKKIGGWSGTPITKIPEPEGACLLEKRPLSILEQINRSKICPHDQDFELPDDLHLDLVNDDMESRESFMIGITPCLVPVGIFQGRSTSLSYEFYNSMAVARQCGLGQLPINLYFHKLLESRGIVSSALIMSKALEIEIPNLGDCDRLHLSAFIHISFQAWWQEWATHIFHQSARFYLTELIQDISPQVPDGSIPSVSNSGQKISYAMVLAPSGNSVLESAIGLTAPKVSSLLQGPIAKETTKRKTPAGDKPQKPVKKSKVADQADPVRLDPFVEEFLDDQVMEEEVDAAAADVPEEEKPSAETTKEPSAKTTTIPPVDDQANAAQPKKTRHAIRKERTQSAPFARTKKATLQRRKRAKARLRTPSPSPPPSPIASPRAPSPTQHRPTPSPTVSRQQKEADASTTDVHSQNLADMFSFDISQFLDDEGKEPPITTKALISDELKKRLSDIANRLESSLEFLVEDCTPIRIRVQEIQDQLPEDLMENLTPAIFLEQYRFKLHKAKERIAERRERESLESALTASKAQVNSDKTRLDELAVEPIILNNRLEELRHLEADLVLKLEATRKQIQEVETGIAASPKAIEDQTAKLKASAKYLATLSKSLKPIPGSTADDTQVIEDIDQICRKAIAAIENFIG
uniref:Aminotransferase-like n=1 Tax=Oryza minuta TaxID=63629 RepID=A0A1V1H0U3_ORYMI|nr:aminotransferase-like [Oryza minuta]